MNRRRAARIWVGLILALGLLVAPVGALADTPLPTVQQVTRHLDDLYRSRSSRATVTMRIKTKHFSRTLEIESWTVGEDHALMVIRKPARESGTATLRTKDGLWNYAPRADRLVRIPTSLLSESWMGSHFTNDDLVRESSYDKDYDTVLAWVEIEGKRRLQVTMTPKPEAPVIYTKVEFTLSADGWLPVQTDWYDGAEVVRKTVYSDVKSFGGRRIPATMTIIPTDKPNESTAVTYGSLEFDAKVDAKLFTPRGLRRAAQRR